MTLVVGSGSRCANINKSPILFRPRRKHLASRPVHLDLKLFPNNR
jgi:hypothetical protein